MFPDKASLYICGIEDRQYKEEKIYCKLKYWEGPVCDLHRFVYENILN